jgi:type VI secretion system protein ImpK
MFTMFQEQMGGESVVVPRAAGVAAAETTPEGIRQTLLTLLKRQALEVRRTRGDFAAQLYREAQYVMAALADEVFLYLDWSGVEIWRSKILESELFESHRAGDAIFTGIDTLLENRDPVYIDLAKIYLMALGLGFEGRYRGRDGETTRSAYRGHLLDFIATEEPDVLDDAGPVFRDAYLSTLDEGMPRKLPYLKMWAWGFAVVAAAWLVASIVAWRTLLMNLKPLIDSVLAAS